MCYDCGFFTKVAINYTYIYVQNQKIAFFASRLTYIGFVLYFVEFLS